MRLVTKGARTLAFKELRPANHPQFWQSRELKDRVALHMHTIQEMRVNVMSAREGVRWHTEHQGASQYGATEGSALEFMTNAFTWVNLQMQPAAEHTMLEQAQTAVHISTVPARVVALCHASTVVPEADKVRVHTLARIPTGAIRLTHTTTQTVVTRANTEPLKLVQMDNAMAPQANYLKLATELSAPSHGRVIECIPPPWAIKDRVYHRHELPELTHRHPSSKYPATAWCRRAPTMAQGVPSRPTPSASLLAAIGAGPPAPETERRPTRNRHTRRHPSPQGAGQGHGLPSVHETSAMDQCG